MLDPAAAVAAVAAIVEAFPGTRPLANAELVAYRARRVTAGWRLRIRFSDDVDRRMDLLVESGFPREAPLVALVDRPPFLEWAHVEKDGVLCLLPNTAHVSAARPGLVAQAMLSDAIALVEDSLAGRTQEDLRAEFHSYWGWGANSDARPLRSLIDPTGGTRLVRAWSGKSFHLVAEDDAAITGWLNNYLATSTEGMRKTAPALVLALDRPLLPTEYPVTACDLERLAKGVRGGALLSSLVDEPEIVVLLVTGDGGATCMGGVLVPMPMVSGPTGRRVRVVKGFRPAKVPHRLNELNRLGDTRVLRASVDRLDHGWVHGRGFDQRAAALRHARVAIIGCGSVGAPIATALAQAGVGRLDLIDPENLSAANIGRHPLGATDIGRSKADALATQLRRALPHCRLEALAATWGEAVEQEPDLLDDVDLIVCAIGTLAPEAALDAVRRWSRSPTPMLVAWTEAYAVAGHAVALFGGDCLSCGMTDEGTSRLAASDWPASTLRREAGCGSFFQPYGPAELMQITAMASSLAIELLVGDVSATVHRIWSRGERGLQRAGAEMSLGMRALAGPAAGALSFTVDAPWPRLRHCIECDGVA